jgi:hypothetical protein
LRVGPFIIVRRYTCVPGRVTATAEMAVTATAAEAMTMAMYSMKARISDNILK